MIKVAARWPVSSRDYRLWSRSKRAGAWHGGALRRGDHRRRRDRRRGRPGAGAPRAADAQLDALPAAGYGSTSGSAAVIRVYYSTLHGTALAYEGYHYWRRWAEHLGLPDDGELARFHECGSVVIKTADNQRAAAGLRAHGRARHPVRGLGRGAPAPRAALLRHRSASPRRAGPTTRPSATATARLAGAVFFPTCGYVNDPQLAARNLQRAAEAHGGRFRFKATVTEIRRAGGRVAGRHAGRRHARSTRRSSSTSPARIRRSSTAWPASRPRCRYARGRCARRLPGCRPRRAWISANGR